MRDAAETSMSWTKRRVRRRMGRIGGIGGLLTGALAMALLAPPAFAVDTRGEAPSSASQEGTLPQAGDGSPSTKVVLVSDDRLTPRRLVVEPGQRVAWISYAKDGARVIFQPAINPSILGGSLVKFERRVGALRSIPLTTGDAASFAGLAPGIYHYRVVRPARATDAERAPRSLEGVIEVRAVP